MVRMSWIHKAGWLLAVNRLVKGAVEESILDVKLMNRPGAGSGDGENSTDGRRLDHWTEGLVIVDAVLLGEAANYPARFIASQSAVGVELVLEDPFAGDNIGAWRARDEAPGVVVHESFVLVFHRSAPIGICEGTARGSWDRMRRGMLSRQGEELHGGVSSGARPRHHPVGC